MDWQTILVAEDDEPVAAFLIELLEDFGYPCVLCSNGEEALRTAAALRPRLVLIGLDGRGNFEPGWNTASKMARLLPAAHLVMLATSQAALEEFGVTERGHLFTAALLKPFRLADFADLVERLYDQQLPDSGVVE